MAELFPRPFGKYTLLEPLAQGGMGSLYLACLGEAGMEKLCVVKTVLRALADKEYLARFRDEAKVVVRLSHGNLVPVFDAGSVSGELYVAMDYVDGKDLRAVWNRCAKKGIAFPVDVAVHLVRELARGLHHAHTAGDLKLVHRDVSPPNVLLAFSGEVRLTDFGLASSTLKLEHTAPGVIYGKVSYMAPEQARGEPLDGRADLYAAGIILWELLTGRQLFPSTEDEVLQRVRNPSIDPPSSRTSRVPKALDAIVLKALAPATADRYQDCEQFRQALAEFLAREAPTIDTARVAAFLGELFGEEIAEERRRRQELVDKARRMPTPQTAATPSAEPRAPDEPIASTPANAPAAVPEASTDAPSGATLIGTLIDGRYRIDRLIGEGGMGRVYEAEHVEIGKRVAIKVLHPVYSRSREAVERFRREARAASRIGHPSIVDVTDSGTTADGSLYFVMEYLEGEDLADLLGRVEKLPVDRAFHIAIQLGRTLQAAHLAGIVHRDLKPENVFLVAKPGQRENVKVLDFGIARRLDPDSDDGRLTNPNMAVGTPEYMAPEQAAGKPADARADVYAAGAILFEMLTGRPPISGDNYMEVLARKASELPPLVSDLRPEVSREIAAVVAQALARAPEERFPSMEAFAQALERCRPERRTRRTPEEVTPVMADRAPFRTSWRQVAAVGLGALLVGGLGSFALRRSPPSPAVQPAQVMAPEPSPVKPVLASRTLPAAERTQGRSVMRATPPADTPRRRAIVPPSPALTTIGEGRRLLQEGNLAEAIRKGQRAVLQGGGVPAHLLLGDVYVRVRQFDAAAREYRTVLKLKPHNTEARARLQAAERKAAGG